jgi:hypothetical protein
VLLAIPGRAGTQPRLTDSKPLVGPRSREPVDGLRASPIQSSSRFMSTRSGPSSSAGRLSAFLSAWRRAPVAGREQSGSVVLARGRAENAVPVPTFNGARRGSQRRRPEACCWEAQDGRVASAPRHRSSPPGGAPAGPAWCAVRRVVSYRPRGVLLVCAPAGSGKTVLLLVRRVRLAARPTGESRISAFCVKIGTRLVPVLGRETGG